MPKNKSKQQRAKSPAFGNDDDFDKMLAEVTAADPVLSAGTPASIATTANAASSSSGSRDGEPGASTPGVQVDELEIAYACKQGDIAQLRRWGRQGVRVRSAIPLVVSVNVGASLDILRCLVKELGADVNFPEKDGQTALFRAAGNGRLDVLVYLVKELGGDVFKTTLGGTTLFAMAAQKGHLDVMRYMVKEFGADVNQARQDGVTPLFLAAQNGLLLVVRCMVKELGADVNKGKQDGVTPLMSAAANKHEDMVAFLLKYGADPQHSAPGYGIAAHQSVMSGAPKEQTLYIMARTRCANPACDGTGVKKCAGCLKVYYCARECQLAHWATHKAECRRSAEAAAGTDNST
jgi:hypothetical protein